MLLALFGEIGHNKGMGYYNYHAVIKRLIRDGKLKNWYITERYNGISPALVLVFDDLKHPVMPIREYRWQEYLPHLKPREDREEPNHQKDNKEH